ncbi:MAG: HEAT repeat domain-containing protein, partial [Chthoniobacteraceae bacterium]|nr:HEAT repeat domain-containing protein [Chthoniobacteraceae bacterium]
MKTPLSIVLLALLALAAPLRAVPTGPKPLELPATMDAKETGWSANLESALARAGREYQPILVVFSSPGCGWCKRLKTEVFVDPDVAELLRHFVRVEIDVTQNETAAFQFQVRGTPALRILDAAGQMQSAADGFLAAPAFLEFLRGALNPAFLAKTPESLAAQLKALDENRLEPEQWPALLLALGNKVTHKTVHDRLLKLTPPPGRALVAQLTSPRLAVRLAALEVAEEIAGDDFGFDPWATADANREALSRWTRWAEAPKPAQPRGVLGEEQIRVYLRDIASQDRERSSRALRMLQNGGEDTLGALDAEQEKNPPQNAVAKNRIREVRYALVLPAIGKQEPLALAHQLVFGNLDTRIQALTLLNGGGDAVLPVAREYLDDGEAMVREAAVDTLLNVARGDAAPLLETHLRREKDANVIYGILHGFKKSPCAKADEILLRYLRDSNEDLAVASIESLSKSKKEGLDKELRPCLEDPRWRVRVAALETAAERNLTPLASQVQKAVDDPDAFVRAADIQTLPKVSSAAASAKKIEEAFLRDDDLKPAAVKALASMKKPVPPSFGEALKTAKPEVIIGVIEALGTEDDQGVELAAAFADHPDPDVACTAIRMLAAKRLSKGRACAVITRVLQGGDREKILTALLSAKVEGAQFRALRSAAAGKPERPAAPGIVATIAQAFRSGAKADTATIGDLAAAAEKLFQTTGDAQIRAAAALFLVRGSHPEALRQLDANYPSLTARDRTAIAEALSDGASAAAGPLLRRLLADPSEEVREKAAEACKESGSDPALFALLLETLLDENPVLKPADIVSYDLFSAMDREPFRTAAAPWVRKLLAATADPQLPTLGLLLLPQMWQKGDADAVRPHLESSHPWQRRAAFQALAWCEPELFRPEVSRVAQDSSEAVRAILPEAFARGDRDRVCALDDEHSD